MTTLSKTAGPSRASTEETLYPWPLGTDLEGNACGGLLLGKTPQALAVIGNVSLVHHFNLRVEHSDGVLLVAEIETNSDRWNGVFDGSSE